MPMELDLTEFPSVGKAGFTLIMFHERVWIQDQFRNLQNTVPVWEVTS